MVIAICCALLAALQSDAHPAPRVPVLLVPGWGDRAGALEPLRHELLQHGWPVDAVRALEFDDRYGSNIQHAREIALGVALLQEQTRAARVDVVAHSMGGLALRYYLRFLNGASNVRRAIFLATPHRGTWLAPLAWGRGAREMTPGSEFLERLNTGWSIPAGVEAITMHTPLDLRILPSRSTRLAGAHALRVCCPTHPGLIRHRRALLQIRQVLLRN